MLSGARYDRRVRALQGHEDRAQERAGTKEDIRRQACDLHRAIYLKPPCRIEGHRILHRPWHHDRGDADNGSKSIQGR